MKLDSHIKVKSFPWTVLPILSTYTAHAIYPNIYIPKEIYNDLQSETPNTKNIALLLHEQTHIERQKEYGLFTWGLKYCFNPKFRFEEELEAIKNSMKLYKKQNLQWDTHKSAKYLSSSLYFWCSSYQNAKKRLEHEWKNIT